MQELDIVDTWTRANEPLPQAVLSYVISPLPSAGGMPQAWSMVRGAIEGATAWGNRGLGLAHRVILRARVDR